MHSFRSPVIPSRLIIIGLSSLIVAFSNQLKCQEVRPLSNNPELKANSTVPDRGKRDHADTLTLPFIDDFSYQGPYPDDSLWQDQKAYVNTKMAVDPPTYGVATLDGLDKNGNPYNPGRDNRNNGLPTDTLTSTWLDLSLYQTNRDTVYISFWYQEKGLGDAPAPVDSLLIQVKTQADTPKWRTIWRKNGSGENPKGSRSEGLVLLNLGQADSNVNYYYDGFQFRFLTYGNLSGNLDHWHLDYITVTEGGVAESSDGTLLPFNQDVAVVEPPVSLLKSHRAMPWNQVKEDQIRDSFQIRASNVSNELVPVRTGYELQEAYTQIGYDNFDLDITANVDPFLGKQDYQQDNKFQFLDFINKDSLAITIKPAVFLFGDDLKQNDTFFHKQYFNHYIAYDDGSPEAGFGFKNFFQAAKAAQEFQVNRTDTLQAVGFRFNQSRSEVGNRIFDIKIWSDLGPLETKPANPTEERTLVAKRLRYNGRGRDNYAIYELEKPLTVSGKFYIGWSQTANYFLNLGVDKNYKNLYKNGAPESRVFYNSSGEWVKASNGLLDSGVLMIRPYLGGAEEVRFKNRDEQKPITQANQRGFKVYPNPASNYVTIEFLEKNGFGQRPVAGELLNQKGQIVKKLPIRDAKSRFSVKNVRAGIYFVKIPSGKNTGQYNIKKLLLH